MKITVNSRDTSKRPFKQGDIVQHHNSGHLYILADKHGEPDVFSYLSLTSCFTGVATFSPHAYKLFESSVTLRND